MIGRVPVDQWTRGLQMIERHIRGNSPDPRAKASRRVEPGAPPICPPEGFDDDILSGTGVLEDPPDPAIDVSVELPEERFERIVVALDEPLEETTIDLVRHWCLSRLTWPGAKRF